MRYCSECSASVPAEATLCPTCGAPLDIQEPTEVDEPKAPELDLEKLQATLSASLSPTYEVLKPVGHGGMGAIFLAREPALKRLVAIKVLAPKLAADKNARARFEREARAAAAISHPNVVRVFAVGETKRTKLPYIVMQYVEGPNLEEWRLRRGRLSEREARRIIGEVAAALAAAHERGLVHRDVKPSNVLLEAETGRAFVADFGVSAALASASDETRLTHTGAVIGTPTYMSPEQSASEPVTPHSDVYSLGILAYELLTGELPFKANSAMGLVAAHLRDTPTPTAQTRPEISPALAQMVDRCLAKTSEERPTADEIARGLLPSLETEVEWPPPGLHELLGRGKLLSRMALFAALGASVAAVAWTFVPEVLLASGGWLERFEITTALSGMPQQTENRLSNAMVLAMFLWQVALTVGLAVYAVATIVFLSTTFRTIERVFRQRSLGWRLSTLIDLLVDHDGRSGLVFAGTGDFASFQESRRKSVLRARRGAAAAEMAGAFWVVVAFAVSTLLLVFGLARVDSTHTLFAELETGLIIFPGFALVLVGLGCRLWERKILGSLARKHSFDAAPDDVARWYETLRAETAKPASPLSWAQDRFAVWSVRIVRLATFLAIPLFALALALGSVATLTAGRFSGRVGAEAAELLETLAGIQRADPVGYARSLWSPCLTSRYSVPGDSSALSLTRMRLSLRHPEAVPSFDVAFASFFDWEPDQRRTNPERAFERALAETIPTDTLELLNELANHPRTTLFRSLAAAQYLGVWDGTGLAERRENSLPLRPLGVTLSEAARANVLAAVLDAAVGNLDSAASRLAENAAVGNLLLRSPSFIANRLGMSILSNQALFPIAALERARGNTERAAQFDRAADQVRMGRQFGNAAGLAPDPDHLEQFVEAVTDGRIPTGYRVSWLRQGWAGLCAHPREILLGPSPERMAAMRSVAESMSDVSQIEEDAVLFEAVWRWPITAAVDGPPQSLDKVRIEDRLLAGSVLRVLACAMPDTRVLAW